MRIVFDQTVESFIDRKTSTITIGYDYVGFVYKQPSPSMTDEEYAKNERLQQIKRKIHNYAYKLEN